MSIRGTERTIYRIITDLLKELSTKYEVEIRSPPEVSISGELYPDILIEIDKHKILVQVKINSISKLIEDIVKTYPVAKNLNADLIGILFPRGVRQIRPEELEKVGPNLRVSRGLVLTSWLSQDFEDIKLRELLEAIVRSYVEWKRTKIPAVDYLTIAKVCRETIEDLAIALRDYMKVKQYSDMALSIIGRFDYYKAMLEDMLREEEMKIYIADIMAYLLVLQLLFLHVILGRIYNKNVLPQISNPDIPPPNLIDQILLNIKSGVGADILNSYRKVLGALPYILQILRELAGRNPIITRVLARYIYSLQVLRPEHVKAELFGRIYQLGLPPETRKNLGAFFTRPEAAKLLTELAIEKWDDKVLDPACGSGTLLAEAYQAKMRRAREQRVNLSSEELHKLFLKEHIVGIDIMQFAKELTTIHLVLQNPYVKAEPKIFVGNGIEKMLDDPPGHTILDFIEQARKEYEALKLTRESFDVIIMNPPFTRRERIPKAEREKLEGLLGHIVKGRVGYWAYFLVAADKVIKPGGRLAAVTPEEFFAGRAAESVRRYLLLERGYIPKIIIRSGVEIAFSEGTHYRDYLTVFKKSAGPGDDVACFIVLKKRLSQLTDEELVAIVNSIKEFLESREEKLSTEYIDARKIRNIQTLVSKHIDNLKPLIGLNDIKTQELVLELLEALSNHPTLADYEKRNLIKIKDYNPGQYTTRGVEDYARRLFVSRYKGRGKITFIYVREVGSQLELEVKLRSTRKHSRVTFRIDKSDCAYSLRTPAGVMHMDITGEEEYAIVNPQAIPSEILKISGLVNMSDLLKAASDIKQAYSEIAGNILIVRRARLTSSNICWLAFFSENRIIGPASPMICVKTDALGIEDTKILTMYLNSSIALLQLLGFAFETEGAWVTLHSDQVWSHVHIPDLMDLPSTIKKQTLDLWEKIRKANVPSLYQRLRQRHKVQREIDELALRLLGLENLIPRLNEIYDAILRELDIMQRILEKSGKEKRGKTLEDYEE